MAYRNLPGIDKSILEGVIALAYEKSIAKVSTQELAKRCNISDFTIFQHFKTKENLMYQTYVYINEQLSSNLVSYFKEDSDPLKVYFKMMDFLVSNPEYTNYLISYTSVNAFNPYEKAPDNPGYISFFRQYQDQFPVLKTLSDKDLITVWYSIDASTLFYATLICQGAMPYNEESKKIIALTIFSFLTSK